MANLRVLRPLTLTEENLALRAELTKVYAQRAELKLNIENLKANEVLLLSLNSALSAKLDNALEIIKQQQDSLKWHQEQISDLKKRLFGKKKRKI